MHGNSDNMPADASNVPKPPRLNLPEVPLLALERAMAQFHQRTSVVATISRVMRDPIGRGGWAIAVIPSSTDAVTPSNSEYVVELKDLSLSIFGYGLERIKGQEAKMTRIFPRLTRLDDVIDDLRLLRSEVKNAQGRLRSAAYVDYIDEDKNKVVVVVVRKQQLGDMIHAFTIDGRYIRGDSVKHLRIGEEVLLELRCRDQEKVRFSLDLTPDEIAGLPQCVVYDDGKKEVGVPYGLDDQLLSGWKARPEVGEEVRRRSWQCFDTRIISFPWLAERLSSLTPGDSVNAEVTKVTVEKDHNTVKSVQVLLDDRMSGFLYGNNCNPTWGTPREGMSVKLEVLRVIPEEGRLELTGILRSAYKKVAPRDIVKATVIRLCPSRHSDGRDTVQFALDTGVIGFAFIDSLDNPRRAVVGAKVNVRIESLDVENRQVRGVGPRKHIAKCEAYIGELQSRISNLKVQIEKLRYGIATARTPEHAAERLVLLAEKQDKIKDFRARIAWWRAQM